MTAATAATPATAATAAARAAPPALPTLAGLVHDLEALDALFATWDAERQGAVQAYRTAIEDLHREAIRRLIAGLKQDPGAVALMKEALADELVYGVLRHLGLVKASLQEKVEAALESVRPMLASHGGSVELAGLRPPDTAEVRFLGACDGCAASQLTFAAGVKKAIQDACPEIRHVVEVKGLAAAPARSAAPAPADEAATAAAPAAWTAPAAGRRVRFQSPFALGAADGGDAGDAGDTADAGANADAAWLPAAALAEIPLGGILRREIAGRDVLLSRSGAAITCFTNACAHLAMPLDDGVVADGVVTCRHHGFQYLLESGECLTAPAVQLEQHAVRLIDDRVEVRLRR
jgi:Fe-S cluster biogenesis protein NfuA/nitrite reductase/ring-hydroxylating ferredoxin subunit